MNGSHGRYGWWIPLPFGLLPFLWLKGGEVCIPEEYHFANGANLIRQFLFSWSPALCYGEPAAPWNHSLLVPNGILFFLFDRFGLSPGLGQRLFLSLWIMLTAAAMVWFLKLFTQRVMLLFLGAAFYLLNFYTQSAVFYSAKMYQMLLMPLLFTLTVRLLVTRDLRYSAIHFAVFFCFQAVLTNLPQALALMGVYLIAFAYHRWSCPEPWGPYFRSRGRSLLFFFGAIVPVLFYQGLVYTHSMFRQFEPLLKSATFRRLSSPLSSIFQLRGSWWEQEQYAGIPYDHWRGFYENPVVICVAVSLTVIALSPLILRNAGAERDRRPVLFFSLIFLLSVALASGTSFQGSWFSFLYKNVPGFLIFREPWAKFMPYVILSQAALLSFALSGSRQRIVLSVLVLVLLRGAPFISNRMVDAGNRRWEKTIVRIPEYWKQYEKWTAEHPGSYVLPIPILRDRFSYDWYPRPQGNSNFPMPLLLGRNRLLDINLEFPYSRYQEIVSEFIRQGSADFLKLGPVDYLLDQKDLALGNTNVARKDPSGLLNYFEAQKSLNFGNRLFLFPVKSSCTLSRFCATRHEIVSPDGKEILPYVTSRESGKFTSVVFLQSQPDQSETTVSGGQDLVIAGNYQEPRGDPDDWSWDSEVIWPFGPKIWSNLETTDSSWEKLIRRLNSSSARKRDVTLWETAHLAELVQRGFVRGPKAVEALTVLRLDIERKIQKLQNNRHWDETYWRDLKTTYLYLTRIMGIAEQAKPGGGDDWKHLLEGLKSWIRKEADGSLTHDRFVFKAPEKGDYQVVLDAHSLGLPVNGPPCTVEGRIFPYSTGKSFTASLPSHGQHYYPFGKLHIDPHEEPILYLRRPASVNLVPDSGSDVDPFFAGQEKRILDRLIQHEREERYGDDASGILSGMKVVFFKRLQGWIPGGTYRLTLEQTTSSTARAMYFMEKYPPDLDESVGSFDPGLWVVRRVGLTYPNWSSQPRREQYSEILPSLSDKREAWLCVCSSDPKGLRKGLWRVKAERMESPRIFLVRTRSFTSDRPITIKESREASPVKYQLKVDGAATPFWLVFDESFHPGWRLFLAQPHRQEIAAAAHRIANGYANAWWVDPSLAGDGHGTLELRLEYTPQHWFFWAWIWMGLWACGAAWMVIQSIMIKKTDISS